MTAIKSPFYQIVESNRIEKSIRQCESNRIKFFSPESECCTSWGCRMAKI